MEQNYKHNRRGLTRVGYAATRHPRPPRHGKENKMIGMIVNSLRLSGYGLNKPCIKNIKYHFILVKNKTPEKYFEEQNIFGKAEHEALKSSRRV